ncbi:hypothetical protein [Streptomyces sp. NPDC055607]
MKRALEIFLITPVIMFLVAISVAVVGFLSWAFWEIRKVFNLLGVADWVLVVSVLSLIWLAAGTYYIYQFGTIKEREDLRREMYEHDEDESNALPAATEIV